MPLFDYTGQLRAGSIFQGTLEADSEDRAQSLLADMGVRVTSLRPTKSTGYVAPLSLDDFLFFNEQMASMTRAGVPLETGLRQLASDVGSRKLKRLLLELSGDLASGTPLEQAIAKQERRFPTQYASIVRAGVKTGDLGGTLYGLTSHLRLKSGVRRALIELGAYPFVILVFAAVLTSFLMREVMPQIESIVLDTLQIPDWGMLSSNSIGYSTPGAPDPRLWLAPHFFAVARNWHYVDLAFGLALIAVALFWIFTLLPGGGKMREWWLRRIPGISQIYWSSVLARFSHTSALAAYTGTPLPELIASAGAASGSARLSGAAQRTAVKLEAGNSLETAVRGERELPAVWTCVVSATAERGTLPSALQELARTYEQRAEQWIGIMRAILGPLLLMLVAAALGTIVVVMLTVFTNILRGFSY